MPLCFVKGHWLDIDADDLLQGRIHRAQGASLPPNWQTMPDEQKWAWSEANEKHVINRYFIYKGAECVGELMDDAYTAELVERKANRIGAVVMKTPHAFDGNLGGRGCVVRIYDGLYGDEYLRKRQWQKWWTETKSAAVPIMCLAVLVILSGMLFR